MTACEAKCVQMTVTAEPGRPAVAVFNLSESCGLIGGGCPPTAALVLHGRRGCWRWQLEGPRTQSPGQVAGRSGYSLAGMLLGQNLGPWSVSGPASAQPRQPPGTVTRSAQSMRLRPGRGAGPSAQGGRGSRFCQCPESESAVRVSLTRARARPPSGCRTRRVRVSGRGSSRWCPPAGRALVTGGR